jgi:hypothetical protein
MNEWDGVMKLMDGIMGRRLVWSELRNRNRLSLGSDLSWDVGCWALVRLRITIYFTYLTYLSISYHLILYSKRNVYSQADSPPGPVPSG